MPVNPFLHRLSALGLCICAGCASIVSGPDQEISVTSDPPGATVQVRDQTVTTPATITLARKDDYTVRVAKEGYYENMAELRRKENPWIAGNILWDLPTTGLLAFLTQGRGLVIFGPGSIYDRATGAGYQLVPNNVHLVLDPRDLNDPEPALLTQWQPHIVKEITVPTVTSGVTSDNNGVWVVRRTEGFFASDSLLSRIDPATNTVVATVPQSRQFTDFVVTDDALWYIAEKYSRHCHLTRVDLHTNQETAQVPLPSRLGARLVVGEGAVWALEVATETKGLALVTTGFAVLKVDPHTGAIQGRAVLDASVWNLPKNAHMHASDIAVGLGSVWVVNESQQCVVRLDAQSLQVTAVVPLTHKVSRVMAGDDAIWAVGVALEPKHDPPTQVTRVDPNGNQPGHALCLGSAPRAITAGLGALWMLNSEEKSLQWLDTHTGKLTEKALPLGDRFPLRDGQALTVADGAVWVDVGDRVLRIAPTREKE
jgi:hypothetical protein